MPFGKCKIYSDGSHYIAIPHIPRKKRPRKPIKEEKIVVKESVDGELEPVKKSPVQKSMFAAESRLTPLTTAEEKKYAEFIDYVNNLDQEPAGKPEIERSVTHRELFEEFYEKSKGKRRNERKQIILSQMEPYFQDKETTKMFVDLQFERKRKNMIYRRIRLFRKVNLQEFNYFCTFTYSDEKHTEESFRKKLTNCFSLLSSRKQWKYIGVWERSPEKQRLHFHGIFYIPDGSMPGELVEINDYNFNTHNRQITRQNTYFNERFGRSDFEEIYNRSFLGQCVAYLVKYLEKTGEKLVYSKGLTQYFVSDILDDDIVCTMGADNQKLLLFDDFKCFDDGTYMGQVSREVIAQMPKEN